MTEKASFRKREFKVVGTSFHKEALMRFADENEDFNASKQERFENMSCYNDREYQYTFERPKAELVPEPDNPHDHNAIRVDFDGVTVGHIARKDCAEVRAIIDAGPYTAEGFIGGGAYKEMVLDEDFDSSKYEKLSDYELMEDEIELYARISICPVADPQSDPDFNGSADPDETDPRVYEVLSKVDAENQRRREAIMKGLCPNCGVRIDGSGVYCSACGKPYLTEEEQKAYDAYQKKAKPVPPQAKWFIAGIFILFAILADGTFVRTCDFIGALLVAPLEFYQKSLRKIPGEYRVLIAFVLFIAGIIGIF